MARAVAFELVETLAERLFNAVHGQSGVSWNQLDSEFGQGDYRRYVNRLLEGLWDAERPIIVLDVENDELALVPRA